VLETVAHKLPRIRQFDPPEIERAAFRFKICGGQFARFQELHNCPFANRNDLQVAELLKREKLLGLRGIVSHATMLIQTALLCNELHINTIDSE